MMKKQELASAFLEVFLKPVCDFCWLCKLVHACHVVVGTHTHLFRYRYCMFAHLYDMCQVFMPLLFAPPK